MLMHPNWDPVALSIGPLSIRWYALMYVIGFMFFIYLGKKAINRGQATLKSVEDVDSLFTYGVIGVILGVRLGYVFFYGSHYYLTHPGDILKIWQGGMSFHGGLIGVIVAIALFSWRHHYRFLQSSDFVAPLVPIGLGFGRLGNFINGELWGRLTHPYHFWAMGFPSAHQADSQLLTQLGSLYQHTYQKFGALPRHPSQIYELLLEGIVLFLILFIFTRKPRILGQTTALFLFFYGLFRFIIEFTRAPDPQLGLLAGGLSMGQWLSTPMILIGVLLFLYTHSSFMQKID